jgi:hypothetical protein
MDAGPAVSDGAALWLSIPLLAAAQLWPAYPLQAAGIWGLYGISALTPPGEALLKPLIQVPYYTKPDLQRPVCDTEGPGSRTSSPAAHNQTSAVWPGESATISVPATRSRPKSVDTSTAPSSIIAVCSSSDFVLDHDHLYSPIVTSPKVPIDICTTTVDFRPIDPADDVPKSDIELDHVTSPKVPIDICTTTVGFRPIDPADDVPKSDIELDHMPERSPEPNDINHNPRGGYAMAAAGKTILAILVFLWSRAVWKQLGRPTIGEVPQILQNVIPQRVQHWVDQVHQRFANVGSFTSSIQGAWQWLLSRTLLQRATILSGLFMVSCWFLLKVYSMLFPLGYAYQVWALVSSIISPAIYGTTACISQLVRCTKTAYYNPLYSDGSYIPLITPSTFTGSVCRQIDLCMMLLRGIVRGSPFPGIWHGIASAIYSTTTCLSQLVRCTKTAYYNPLYSDGSYIPLITPSTFTGSVCRQMMLLRGIVRGIPLPGHFIGCLPFFMIVSDYRCPFWANTLNRVLIIVSLIVIDTLNGLAVKHWRKDQARMTQEGMKRVVFDCILTLGPFYMLACFVWSIQQNLSVDEMLYVVTTLSILYVLVPGESIVDWWIRFLILIRLGPANPVPSSHG